MMTTCAMRAATRTLTVLLVLTSVCGGVAAADAKKLLQEGNAQLQARQYAAALALFEKGLAESPKSPELLYNAGMAAYGVGKPAQAAGFWQRFIVVEPDYWLAHEKLVQAYQAIGNAAGVQKEILWVRTRWASRRDRDLSSRPLFVRDQFDVGGCHVLAMEFFKSDPAKREPTWHFVVYRNGEEKGYFALMYDQAASQVAAEKKGGLQELFFLDYNDPRRHGNVTMFTYKPTYDEVAALVKTVLSGTDVKKVYTK